MTKTDVIIIGAGLSGMTVGSRLLKKNKSFIILEKSKGIGGRISTRRIEDLGFDHGAPYLHNDATMQRFLNDTHYEKKQELTPDGFFYKGGMNNLMKFCSKNLPIVKDCRVTKIIKSDENSWIVETSTGEVYSGKSLILTAPIPQALELLKSSGLTFSYEKELKDIQYSKALIGLYIGETISLPRGLSKEVHSLLLTKDRDQHPNGYILRASPEFSDLYFDLSDELILLKLRDLFNSAFSHPPVIKYQELKKWRYVQPTSFLSYPYLEISESLFLIGDGFMKPNASGAILSAEALCAHVLG